MKIGVDAGCLGINDQRLKVGVYQMAVGLFKALGEIDKKNEYILYSFLPIDHVLLESFGKNFKNKIVKPSFLWNLIWLPLEVQRNNIDVFIGLSQNLPLLTNNILKIVFIHDVTFEKYPHFFPKSYNQLHRITSNSIRKADVIIADSKSTKKDILKSYQVSNDKIKVIYLGFDNRFKDLKSIKIPKSFIKKINKPFFLFVGTLKESKNIPNIIRGFEIYCEKDLKYDLIIVGSSYWLDTEITKVLNQSKVKDKIKILGFVSDSELIYLYKNASMFVSPAYNEGFGLTYLEAASFKLPIIASKQGSVSEIFDDSVLYANPNSPESIAIKINDSLSNQAFRKKLALNAFYKSKALTWKNSAYNLLRVINEYEK